MGVHIYSLCNLTYSLEMYNRMNESCSTTNKQPTIACNKDSIYK